MWSRWRIWSALFKMSSGRGRSAPNTRRKIEFPTPGNVPKMWNFLNFSGCRKFQCFRNISWGILGKTIEYNFLITRNLTYQEPFLHWLKFEISMTFSEHFMINIHYIIAGMQNSDHSEILFRWHWTKITNKYKKERKVWRKSLKKVWDYPERKWSTMQSYMCDQSLNTKRTHITVTLKL